MADKAKGNTSNLKPIRSKDEARELGKKGGKASGKARREKKTMQELCKILLEVPLKEGKVSSVEEITSLATLKNKNITAQQAMIISLIQKAINGDMQAFHAIVELSGNKSPTEIAQTVEFKDDAFIKALNGKAVEVWNNDEFEETPG